MWVSRTHHRVNSRCLQVFLPADLEFVQAVPQVGMAPAKILFSGWTTECRTFEENRSTEAELRNCAQLADSEISPAVTVNGVSVVMASVETDLLDISLPDDNIFGIAPGSHAQLAGLSVAHGYEYLTKPLTSRSLKIVNNITFGDGNTKVITTIITVT
jgi:hypothetical protein